MGETRIETAAKISGAKRAKLIAFHPHWSLQARSPSSLTGLQSSEYALDFEIQVTMELPVLPSEISTFVFRIFEVYGSVGENVAWYLDYLHVMEQSCLPARVQEV